MKKVKIIDNNRMRVYSDLRDKIIENHTWDNVTKIGGGSFAYLGNSSMVLTKDEYKKIKNRIVNETCIKFNNYVVITPFYISYSIQKLLNCIKLRSIHYCDLYYSVFSDYEIGDRIRDNIFYSEKSSDAESLCNESKVSYRIRDFDYDNKPISRSMLHKYINFDYHIAKFLYENNIKYAQTPHRLNDITYTHKSGKKLFSTVMTHDKYSGKDLVSIYDENDKYCYINDMKAFVKELLRTQIY